MAQKINEDQRKKFSEITKLKYGDQAKWFLNGFWEVCQTFLYSLIKLSHSLVHLLKPKQFGNMPKSLLKSTRRTRKKVCFFTLTLRVFFGVFMNETGNELDEFQAHKFLESLGETLTVVAMRDRLRQIDLDFNRRVALIEYLTVRYGKVNGSLSLLYPYYYLRMFNK